jgi:hypothetical protein
MTGQLLQLALGVGCEVVALPFRVEQLRVALGSLLGPRRATDAESARNRRGSRGEQQHTIRRARSGEPQQEPGRGDDPVVGIDRP